MLPFLGLRAFHVCGRFGEKTKFYGRRRRLDANGNERLWHRVAYLHESSRDVGVRIGAKLSKLVMISSDRRGAGMKEE